MQPYRRRYYVGLNELREDFQFLISRRSLIRKAIRDDRISKAFRERLMLVVTNVNDCRYCRTFHTSQASLAGISQAERDQLNVGLIPNDTPEDQIPALFYARHWAENNAQPDREDEQIILETYGEHTFQLIQVILRMIRMGNLMGNTWDYLLYRVSGGRWGNRRR